MNIENLQNILNHEWRLFLGGLNGCVVVREVSSGTDKKLEHDLAQSASLFEKADILKTRYHQWPQKRQWQWSEARRAEVEVERKLGEGQNFFSVSHTEDIVVVVGAHFSAQSNLSLRGVGVDIELSSRHLDEKTMERVVSLDERVHGRNLSGVDFWVLKEAAFKATPRDLQLVISQYKLVQWNDKLQKGHLQSKMMKCEARLVTAENFKVGFALA